MVCPWRLVMPEVSHEDIIRPSQVPQNLRRPCRHCYYARVELEKSDYTVDHSAFIYLMGRHGKYLGFFPPGTPADILVGTLKPLVASR
jgi:cytochrome oxidase Cu insertion factor (SCO1/SenC/PrrC family)